MVGCIPKLLGGLLLCGCLGGCGAALVAGPPTGGYSAAKGDRSAGIGASDARITSAINTRYVQDDLISALDVTVKTYRGMVTLAGSVSSREAARRAVDIAHSVEGVTRVVSRLTVVTK